MKQSCATWFLMAAGFLALLVLTGAFYVVSETEQVIVTQFGEPIGAPITTAGVHFKVPFVQQVNRLEKRVLQWDGPTADMPTRDKLYIIVDAFGRWRIKDPLQYFLALRDERSALSRLDDILGSEMRNTVARHALVEIVRTSKDRQPAPDAAIALAIPVAPTGPAAAPNALPQIQYGREALEKEIATLASAKLQTLGIELLDVRFKRINYKAEVSAKIFERMISERRQIADRFRSEGAGEAARILGKKERDLKEIDSQAYQKVPGDRRQSRCGSDCDLRVRIQQDAGIARVLRLPAIAGNLPLRVRSRHDDDSHHGGQFSPSTQGRDGGPADIRACAAANARDACHGRPFRAIDCLR